MARSSPQRTSAYTWVGEVERTSASFKKRRGHRVGHAPMQSATRLTPGVRASGSSGDEALLGDRSARPPPGTAPGVETHQ